MAYLLDTNVVSELRKSRPSPHVVSWFAQADEGDLRLSVLVLGEIRQGIERLLGREPRRAGLFSNWLDLLKRDYGERIVPVTVEVAEAWGRLNAKNPLPPVDGLLAATALTYDWTLVTRNTKHVDRTGARVINPFETGWFRN